MNNLASVPLRRSWRRMGWQIWLVAALIISAHISVSGCRTQQVLKGVADVTLRAADGWVLHGDYYRAPNCRGALLMLHQRSGSAGDWSELARALVKRNISVLALDQRGAGRSLGPSNGDSAPWSTQPDIAAGIGWLRAHNSARSHIGLVGASYGANNALLYAVSHSVAELVLLSPGADYNGLKLLPAANSLHTRLLVLTGDGDSIPGDGPAQLKHAVPSTILVAYHTAAHGTALLSDQPASIDAIVRFVSTPAAVRRKP